MASDLPETRPEGGATAMAKRLVTYLDDPEMIRSAIKAEYGSAPQARTIRIMRSVYLANRERPQEAHNPSDAWRPGEASERMEEINQRFVGALQREREASDARALRSQFLTEPRLVSARFDMEAEAAWRQNGELAA